jgi:transcriptional regulator GlxA family with amidase domain
MAPKNFGILLIRYQNLDVCGPVDMLESCSKRQIDEYARLGVPGTAELTDKAIDIDFHYISETLDPVTIHGGLQLLPTTTVDACPPLDYLLIGGPDPFTFKLSDAFSGFLKSHVAAGKVIFTTCSGGLAISPSGVLDGKRATTNHEAMNVARQTAKDVLWEDKRWVVDGQFWTASAACSGMDMFAAWVIEHLGLDIAKCVFAGFDYVPRDIDGKLLVL